jgi:hypothetical protein
LNTFFLWQASHANGEIVHNTEMASPFLATFTRTFRVVEKAVLEVLSTRALAKGPERREEMYERIFEALADAARSGEQVAMGVICGTKGSSPQKLGAKALFHADGRITGTLGGGCLEAVVQRRAMQTISTGKPARFDLLLDHDFGWDDGLICGGKVCGVIVPKAEQAGELFWRELAVRAEAITWGIRDDFSIHQLPRELATFHPEPTWFCTVKR